MMVATESQFQELYGAIGESSAIMAWGACVACNACTCACSCRKNPNNNEIEWAE